MLIYTPKITNRIKYIFETIFSNIWGVNYELTENIDYFKKHTSYKLNYSSQKINNELFIESHSLLFENKINDQNINISQWNNIPIFFQTGLNSSLPFDIFAASFYLISRYEEYLPHIKDHYNRFTAKESLAFKNNFLQKPLINIWLKSFFEIIKLKYPNYVINNKSFKFISTIDVDNAYCYYQKGFVRNLAGFFRSIFQNKIDEFKDRWDVITSQKSDPYDTFEHQLNIQEKYKINVIYFVLLGDYGLNDKNIPFYSKKFQLLIKHLSDHADVGIHPSFGSNEKYEKLKFEILRLKNIIKKEVHLSRQHFLKLSLPKTYRNLIKAGVKNDYTMGYAALPGFRASICNSFYFYDLEIEESTLLLVHPFVIMDATFKYYLNYSPSETFSSIKDLVSEVKKVNGTFISLWHNETFSEYGDWKGWSHLYEDIIKLVVND